MPFRLSRLFHPLKLNLSSLSKTLTKLFKTPLFVTFCSATVIIGGTYVAIQFAKGYRPALNGNLQGTGLLAANSFPNGAQVYLNGKLVTATDATLNLNPGEYAIEIKKDGFSTWKKSLKIEKELVTQTNAVLFPAVPGLTPLTYTGATNISSSPDGQKLVFYVASASAQIKNGLYILDLTDSLLSLKKGPRQISQETRAFNLAQTKIIWSPDSSQILLSFEGKNVVLDPNKMNALTELQDVSYKLPRLFSEWEEDVYKRERTSLAKFPDEIQQIATESAINVYFSPDEERVIYTATVSAILPDNILPSVPAANSQPQERTLQPGGVYIYDRKEDRNFRVGTEDLQKYITQQSQIPQETTKKAVKKKLSVAVPTAIVSSPKTTLTQYGKLSLATDLYTNKIKTLIAQPLAFQRLQGETAENSIQHFVEYYSSLYTSGIQWLPDSKHLLGLRGDTLYVKEYDGTNENTLYSGQFNETFVYPWPNGSKIILLTRFSQAIDNPTNLYAITLR